MSLAESPFQCKNMKTIDNAIDKYMDDIEQGKAG